MCVQISFLAPSLHPYCCSNIPDLAEAGQQFIMTTTGPLVVQERYCYFTVQKHHVTFYIVFFSGTTFLGKLWVSTKNSEPMTWYYDTLRNNTAIKFDIICACNFSGPEKLNDNSVKIMRTELMDTGFTVTPEPTNFGRTGPSMISEN